ncbi:hypothetical protein V2J52_05460 [Georgenia sp. MJ173]
MTMHPHLLHDFAARSVGTTLADYTRAERTPASRPRKPRTTFGWPGTRR